ncbi:MAG: pimeloyl-ACP methyl ester carboxylesterase [Paracoccaceae bacterium]|jgi:pimeloyl-ACP methyl ester carboxylesterase
MTILIFVILGGFALLGLANLWSRTLARDAEQVVPQPGQVQRVKGAALHYVDLGPRDAPPVVLIHGLSAQLQHFTYAVSGMLAADYRVIAVDRPGCGYSVLDAGDGAPLAEQGQMIGELLDTLGIGPAVLVGHSLGGAVALSMAMDRPDKTTALALLCPLTQVQPGTPDMFKGLEIRSSFLRRLIGNTIAGPIAKFAAGKMLAEAFAPETCPPDFMDKAGAALGLRPGAFITASSDLCAVEAQMPALVARYDTALKTPGGILYGADDNLLDPDLHGQGMVAHGLSCESLPGRGHMIPITAPEDCASFIRRMAGKVVT